MAAIPAWVGYAVAAAGVAASAYGQYASAQTQEKAYKYNEAITKRKGAQEEQAHRDRLRKLLSSQRALYAKAGVDLSSGSPLLVMEETAYEGEKEALAIRTGAQEESSLLRFYGSSASRAGTIGSGGTLLTGLGQTGMNYAAYKKAG